MSSVRRVVAPLLLVGCGADLLPGERVLGDEVPAVIIEGAAGDGFGAAVAVGSVDGQAAVLVSAVDVGRVDQLDAGGVLQRSWSGGRGLGQDLAVSGGQLYALEPGIGVRRLDTDTVVPVYAAETGAAGDGAAARRFAVCPGGAVWTVDRDGEDIACGPGGGILWLRCPGDDASCTVVLDGEVLDAVDPGGAVGFDGARACWGEVMAGDPEGAGRYRCLDGVEGEGLPGEHLGVTMAGGGEGEALVAGVFDKWIVPARARIHVVDGGEVWAVDDADENARLALARGEGLVVVGLARYRRGDRVAGRTFIVDVDAAGGLW